MTTTLSKLSRLTATVLLAFTVLSSPACGGGEDEDLTELEELLDELEAFEGDLSDDVMEVTGIDEALEIEE